MNPYPTGSKLNSKIEDFMHNIILFAFLGAIVVAATTPLFT